MKIKEGTETTNSGNDPLEPKNSPSDRENLKNYLKSSVWCTIWDDVGTYLTSSIDSKEKASLIIVFAHLKMKGKQ